MELLYRLSYNGINTINFYGQGEIWSQVNFLTKISRDPASFAPQYCRAQSDLQIPPRAKQLARSCPAFTLFTWAGKDLNPRRSETAPLFGRGAFNRFTPPKAITCKYPTHSTIIIMRGEGFAPPKTRGR